MIAPVALRNRIVGHDNVLIASQGGINFYIGNNKAAVGFYEPIKEGHGSAMFERDDATILAEQSTGRKLTPSEVSHYWTGKALNDIRADFPHWLGLLFKKWLLVWNAGEMGDSDDQYTYADWSPLLQGLNRLLHFGTLCPLASLGIWLTWNRRKRVWPLYAMILVYAGSVTLFYVFSRYRFPLVPMLILFAAAGLTSLRDAFREARWRPLWAGAAAAIVVAAVCNQGMISEALIRADAHINLGNAFVIKGEIQNAIGQYEQALQFNPNDPEVPVNLAAALLKTGRFKEAVAYYEQALRIHPDDARAHYNVGIALLRLHQPNEAIGHFEHAVRIEPDYAEAQVILGSMLYDQGKVPEAVGHWEQALRSKPDFSEAHYNLANAFLREGRFEESIEHYGQALKIKPEYAEAHCNLGIALERVDRVQEAIEHYEQAILLRPDLVEVQKRMAILRAGLRRQGAR